MIKTSTVLAAALLITTGDAVGQGAGTNRQLNRLINETNVLLGESKDLLRDVKDKQLSLLRLLETVHFQAPLAKRKANALRNTLRTNIARFGEIRTECGAIANKIKRTSWPPQSGDVKERGSFAQRAMDSARGCERNARIFADGHRETLRKMAEAGFF